MRKQKKDPTPRTVTDIKIFILFLLDRIRYPIDKSTLVEIIFENTDSISFDYDACLAELERDGLVYFDEDEDDKYYMISEKGRAISAELYENLDGAFRERSIKSVAKHLSLSARGVEISATVARLGDKRYSVTLMAKDKQGEIMNLSVTVASLAEAEEIRRNYEINPGGVYRGVLFSATSRLDFIS